MELAVGFDVPPLVETEFPANVHSISVGDDSPVRIIAPPSENPVFAENVQFLRVGEEA